MEFKQISTIFTDMGKEKLCKTELQSLKETSSSFTPLGLLTFSLLLESSPLPRQHTREGVDERKINVKIREKDNSSEQILLDLNTD